MKTLPQELIRLKRDGHRLSGSQLIDFAQGVASGEVSEAQIAAFAMAVIFQDMDVQERIDWTCAVRDTGRTLVWDKSKLRGPIVDKHSTGGVGDGVSLMLGPMLAACGVHVPMIAGRGLAHTGGTIDKLEAIPGYNTGASVDHFQKVVREVGISIVRQTDDLAPADRRMYAVRDVTATVENIGMITASIVSKKLAAGLESLVLDVKTGNGAVMQDLDSATDLAKAMVDVANGAGVKTTAIVTDMSEVLSFNAGNALEIHECIEFLKDESPHPRLNGVVFALGGQSLVDAGLYTTHLEAERALRDSLSSGRALEVFSRMVHSMGGPSNLVDKSNSVLASARVIKSMFVNENGYIQSMNVRQIGLAVVELGGGRVRPNEKIDHSVGLSKIVQVGAAVDSITPICTIHAQSEKAWEDAANRIRSAIQIGPSPAAPGKLIHKVISSNL